MSAPIKPSLDSAFPRKPRPRAVRPVQCPRCDHRFIISRKAISVRCPKCTEPMSFEDFTVRSDVQRNLSTMGAVCISPGAQIAGNIVCGRLTNEGRIVGRTRVYGPVLLVPESIMRGELVSHSLNVLYGAKLRAKALIGPRFRTLAPPDVVRQQQNMFARPRRILAPLPRLSQPAA